MTLSMPVLTSTVWRRPYHLIVITVATLMLMLSARAAYTATVPDTIAQRMMACSTCHGVDGRASSNGFYPRIAGKPEDYLFNQLRHFKYGQRQYPAMTFLLDNLSEEYLREIAHYYAQQNPPYPPPAPVTASTQVLARGKLLALEGDAKKNIPACISCHGARLTGVTPAVPGLVGLPRDYLNAQFGSWRSGSRKAAAPDCMQQITAKLSLEDINAVSSWIAAQAVPTNSKPDTSFSAAPPLTCGSITHQEAK
jgi:cytochrome c553